MKKLFIIFLLFSGCGPSFEIIQKVDRFNDVTHNFTSDNVTVIRNGTGIVNFDFAQSITKDTTYHSIKISYVNIDWLFISEGNSLNLLIDGKKIALSGDGSQGHREVGSPFISEAALYYCNPKILHQIVNAGSVEFQIRGKYIVECVLTDQNKKNLSEFVNRFVK